MCHCQCSAVSGSMLLKAGAAGLDDAGCVRARIACGTGSTPWVLALLLGCGCDDVCCTLSGVVSWSGVPGRAVLALSSNVVGVGEEPVSLPDWWGADLQVFSVLMVRDALRGIKPSTKTSQSWLFRRREAVLVSAERGFVAGEWAVSESS